MRIYIKKPPSKQWQLVTWPNFIDVDDVSPEDFLNYIYKVNEDDDTLWYDGRKVYDMRDNMVDKLVEEGWRDREAISSIEPLIDYDNPKTYYRINGCEYELREI